MKMVTKLLLVLMAVVLSGVSAWSAELVVLRNGFTVRDTHHEQRDAVTRLYLSSGGYVEVPTEEIVSFEPDEEAGGPEVSATERNKEPLPQPGAPNTKATPEIADVIRAAGNRSGIDPDLIRSIIRAESGFQAKALSPKGAQGLMQLMPGTAARLKVDDPLDPVANVNGGTRYLAELLVQYDDDLIKALAAYNAGPQRVSQYRGVPPFPETRAYVAKVVRNFNETKLAQQRPSPARAVAATKAKKKYPSSASQGTGSDHIPSAQ